jgi:hypothetical protein
MFDRSGILFKVDIWYYSILNFSVKSWLFYGNDHFRTSPKQNLWRTLIQTTQTSSSFLKRMYSTCSESAEPPCGACAQNGT